MFIPMLAFATALTFQQGYSTHTTYEQYECVKYYNEIERTSIVNNIGESRADLAYGITNITQYMAVQVDVLNETCRIYFYDEIINYDVYVEVNDEDNGLMYYGSVNLLYDLDAHASFTLESNGEQYSGGDIFVQYYFNYRNQAEYNAKLNTVENEQQIFDRGYESGYGDGVQRSNENEYNRGKADGDAEGYRRGLEEGIESGDYAYLFTGILDVGLLPVNIFLAMLNIEFFGINIGGFITGILTLCVVIVCARSIMGSSGGGKE